MNSKLKVGLVFGGRSAEHQVSLQSAMSIYSAIDTDKYDIVLIGITPEGKWLLGESADIFCHSNDPKKIALTSTNDQVVLVAGDKPGQLIRMKDGTLVATLDVLFPVLHGPYGEDGTIQGLAKLANIPCVGSGILGSSVGMDKDFTKRILMHAGISVAPFVTIRATSYQKETLTHIEATLGYPVFVKPANMGSSIGVSKANNREELMNSIQQAFEYDSKLLVEAGIVGREIECAVLGNYDLRVSIPGEVKSVSGFYDYHSKYIDDDGAVLSIPAILSDELTKRVQQTSAAVFEALECRGLSRVDVFVTEDEQIIVNEVNTLPGFTKISMYPKLFQASGLSYAELIDQLITLASEDFIAQA